MSLGWETTVAVDSVAWAAMGVGASWRGSRWSDDRVAHDGPVTRLRSFEAGGQVYRRLGIRRWLRLLPDLAHLTGRRRKDLPSRGSRQEWEELAAETRRSERVHWLLLFGLTPLLIFNRGWLAAAMVIYALASNLPCIMAQRYNRARLLAFSSRLSSRTGPPSA